HRLLGRIIGVAFAVPLVWFWIKRRIPAGYKVRLVALLVLGGLQGVFGWFMVRSGLSEQVTDVSHFWLSIHLLTALVTLGALVWVALDLLELHRNPSARRSEEHTSELQSREKLVCRLLLEKKKTRDYLGSKLAHPP